MRLNVPLGLGHLVAHLAHPVHEHVLEHDLGNLLVKLCNNITNYLKIKMIY